MRLEVVFFQRLFNEQPLAIRARRVFDVRVIVDLERVRHPAYKDILVEAVFTHVIGQHADIPQPVHHLVFAGRVVGNVRIAVGFNVAHQAHQNLSHFRVGLVIGGPEANRGAVLPDVIRHLANVLRHLVDGQHRATLASRLVLLLPLPRVIRRSGSKANVLPHLVAIVRAAVERQRKALFGSRQDFVFGHL